MVGESFLALENSLHITKLFPTPTVKLHFVGGEISEGSLSRTGGTQ